MAKKQSWTAEKLSMERDFALITGKKTKIIDIGPKDDRIGYTGPDQKIYISEEHPIMKGLKDAEKIAFRKGVFCHEMLHQIFSDFDDLEKHIMSVTTHERKIFASISNILEDPAIEYLGPTVVSGPLLKSLRFAIAHIYKKSMRIEECKTAMGQYTTALIQFGDIGLLKGYFTFPEAKKCFAETAEIFERGITEPNAQKRLDYSKEIFEISRPLWQTEADIEKILQELAEMMSDLGKSPMSGKGRGKDADSSDIPETKKSKRRKVTIKKVTKEELEELKKNGSVSDNPIPEDGDISVLVCDEKTNDDSKQNTNTNSTSLLKEGEGDEAKDNSDKKFSKEKGSDSSPEDSKEDNPNGATSESDNDTKDDSSDANSESDSLDDDFEDDSAAEDSKGSSGKPKKRKENNETGVDEASNKSDFDGANDGNKNENDGDKTDNSKTNNSSVEKNRGSDSREDSLRPKHESEVNPHESALAETEDADYNPEDERIDSDEYILSEEDVEAIMSDLMRIEEEIKEKVEVDNSEIPDYDISSPKMPHKSCVNLRIKITGSQIPALERAYTEIVNRMATGISTTTKALKRIFEDDKEEREYRSSGSISLKRLYCGSVTSQIFERKIAPADKRDLVVEILVDESGSMETNNKYLAAQKCCIALAEIFNNLNIPVYVMGFTADIKPYDITHLHYITWKNSRNDRLKLLNITARADNCDGASIRYATEVLKKKQAKNKLLIVLSDGMPSAINYPNGKIDTKDAIRAAKKHTSVLGVAIGNNDTKSIQYLYEKDFLHVSNVEDLFAGVAKKLKNIIKTW